uniref:Uncharacterized protein n=1 Tax=Panagrolaimus sp. ES5 TaxID=591445 RepID=A0AC34GPV4_9BILA
MDVNSEHEERKDFKEAKSTNNSTLSIHIAAYENCVESDASDFDANSTLIKKEENAKHFSTNSLANIQGAEDEPNINPLPRDPRVRSGVYATRVQTITQRQQIIADSVDAPQIRDANAIDISDEESDGGERNNPAPPHQPPPLSSRMSQPSRELSNNSNAAGSSFGQNILRNTRLNIHSGAVRSTYPILVVDDECFGASIQALPSSIPPPELVTNRSNIFSAPQTQNSTFQSSAGLNFNFTRPAPPPSAQPLNIQRSPQSSAARIPPPTSIPASIGQLSTSRASTDILQSPTANVPSSSRASTDVRPSPSTSTAPNNPQFMSPTESQSNVSLTNDNYFGSSLRLQHSGTQLEVARAHNDNQVFEKFYHDYKNVTTNDENDKKVQANIIKGLKHLIGDRNTFRDELVNCEKEMAKMGAQIEKMASDMKKNEDTIRGLKGLKETADNKAKKAEDEKEQIEKECKQLKQALQAKDVYSMVQKQTLERSKEKTERLLAENADLKKALEDSSKTYEQEIQKLKDEIKAEKEAKDAMKEKLEEAETRAAKEAQEKEKYRAKKKEAEKEKDRIKLELEEAKKENRKKEEQISRMEKDQKLLAQSNKDLLTQKNEADQKVRELEEKLNAALKEKVQAKKEGKIEGKQEVEASTKPTIEKYNRQQKALKELFRNANIVAILSKKKRKRTQPAAVRHTVSDAGPSSSKRPRIEINAESSNVRPGRPVAIITSEPVSNAQPAPTNSGTSRVASTDSSLFANNGINTLMQQMGSNNAPSVPVTNMPPPIPPTMNRPQLNPVGVPVTQYRPTYAFMPQVDQQPRIVNPMQRQYAPNFPSGMQQQNHGPMQNIVQPHQMQTPQSWQQLEASVTRIIQANCHVTPGNAENVFQALPEESRRILTTYANEIMRISGNSHVNPLIQMIIRLRIGEIQRQQQEWQRQQHQYNLARAQQHQPVYERRQVCHRSMNPNSSSNARSSRNRNVEGYPSTTVNQVPTSQPNQSMPPQHWGLQPPQSIRAGFQPLRPQTPPVQPLQQQIPTVQNHQQPTPPVQHRSQQTPPVQNQQQSTPPVQNRHQQTPPIQNPVANTNQPIIPSATNVSNSTPILAQALRTSNVNNVENEVNAQRLIDLCHTNRRQINGYVRRRFNVPVGDEAYNIDANLLDQSFRGSSRNFVRR